MNLDTLALEATASDFDAIPIIDLSDARSQSLEARRGVANEIRKACLSAGFFYVKNHSVPSSTVDAAFKQSKSFYAAKPEVKKTVDIANSKNFRGYMGLMMENNDPKNKGDRLESFNIGLDPSLEEYPKDNHAKPAGGETIEHGDNQWPDAKDYEAAEDFKKATLDYYSSVLHLGQSLFPLFALALNLPENFFENKTTTPAAIMRLLYYPALGEEKFDEFILGIGAHTGTCRAAT
ncbi:hypothetical protein P7C73_g3971, partial [Tremellales sp. Uapishka_1]